MEIDVFTSLNGIPEEAINNKTIIVVDVLRATTTITAALAAGCLEVIPVPTPEEAIALRERLDDERVLLGGERNVLKIPGFNLGNSPLEYTPEIVAGKRLIITTTNGTQAINRAAHGCLVLLGAMINAPSVAKAVTASRTGITIICAGTREHFSLEDFLAAGFIIDQFGDKDNFILRDGALVARDYYRLHREDTTAVLAAGFHGRQLREMGFAADIDYCSRKGSVDIVPVFKEGIVRVLSST